MNEVEPVADRALIPLKEAAQRLSVSRRTLEREIAAGRFARPLKIGRSSLVEVRELTAYIDRLRNSRMMLFA